MIYELEHKVLPEEVDAFQVVNFSNYLRWCSMTFIHYLESVGLDVRFNNGDTEFRVARLNVNYVASARLNDVAKISICSFKKMRNKLEIHLVIAMEGKVLTRAKMAIAFVQSCNSQLTFIPEELAKVLEKAS
ncbi:acyl-CoA thioesterase [Anaeromicropila populeti]|uniref:Acyl-CoA thioester hydrolase, YbgC/YbaW family n=1 Tax=Anaeromicropila populeti TaxID=37658 RepID=A0A1I6HSF4_9FIRM|nr:acyl-CoA thioesterase [Anaeromicropila populeti]SFR57318.1 acyl-CoA thioester hydrolase, YbgC/YbaW family [Anaeromicropila populeti]